MTITDKKIVIKEKILSTVTTPLRSTQRIRYTCFDVTQNFLIFGCTSGGIYIFQRDPTNFLHLAPSKEGTVIKVCMSKDEKFFAFATLKGITCVYEWNIENKAKLINKSLEHRGYSITELIWSDANNQLFIGDNIGKLSVINVSLFMNKSVFQLPAVVFMQLESAIVQVSCFENYLLVSTEQWCYLCDTLREQYKQIGTKLREGPYGACFFKKPEGLNIYCARPGARLWEVSTDALVQNTHQFRKALATPPIEVVILEEDRVEVPQKTDWPEQIFNFCYLAGIMDRYLFTYKEDGIYLFDPVNVQVVLWSNHIRNISSAKCVNHTIYIWTTDGELQTLVIESLDKCLLNLFFQDEYKLCYTLFDMFLDSVSVPNDYSLLSPLSSGLIEYMETFNIKNDRVRMLLEDISKVCDDRFDIFSSKLDSGIFLVENRHWKKWKVVNSLENEARPRFRSLSAPLISAYQIPRRSFKSQLNSSLPNIKLTLESHLYINESCTSDDEISGVVEDSSQSEHSVPESPFLLSANSDLFQSSRFRMLPNQGPESVSFADRWQTIENRMNRSNKSCSINDPIFSHSNGSRNSSNTNIVFDVENEDSVIHSEMGNVPIRKKTVILDCSNVIKICSQLESIEYADITVSYQLFNCVLEKYKELNQALGAKEDDSVTRNGFPFSKYVPSVCFNVIRTAFHEALRSGKMQRYLEMLNTSNWGNFEDIRHPLLLIKIYPVSTLNLDLCLRSLIIVFSEIIDPHTVLQCLDDSNLPCFYLSWCYILDLFKDNAYSYMGKQYESHSAAYSDWPLPLLLNTLFLMFRLNQVDSSCNISDERSLPLRHVSFLILKLSDHMIIAGTPPSDCEKQCNELILKYVSKLVEKDKVDLFDISVSPARELIENAFLALNCSNKKVCTCGYNILTNNEEHPKFPAVGKLLMLLHLKYYKARDQTISGQPFELRPFGNVNSFSSNDDELRHQYSLDIIRLKPVRNPELHNVFSFCKDYLPIVNLIRAMPALFHSIVLQTDCDLFECGYFIVQFGLFRSTNEYMIRAPEQFLRTLCDLNLLYSQGVCCFCSTQLEGPVDVNWNELMKLVLKSLGGPRTIKVLEDYSNGIPSSKVDISFYRACILSGSLLNRCPDMHSSLLSSYCNTVCRTSQEVSNDSEIYQLDNSMMVDSFRSSQWGIKVDLNSHNCYHCSLTLSSEQLIRNGIRAFNCGHIYHVTCLIHASSPFGCPACGNEEFQN